MSCGFQFKALTPTVKLELSSQAKCDDVSQEGLDFRCGQKGSEKPEIIEYEQQILDLVRFTETFEELDTLSVHSDLVKDPERFIQLCC